MSNSYAFPAGLEISLAAQGESFTVTPAEFAPDAIAHIFAYGVRRFFQDSINAQAKTLRDGGTDITPEIAKQLFAARLDQAMTGQVAARGPATSTDPLDSFRILVLRQIMAADPKGKLSLGYKAIPSDDQPARQKYLLDIATKNSTKIDQLAVAAKAEADAKAKAAKDAASGLSF